MLCTSTYCEVIPLLIVYHRASLHLLSEWWTKSIKVCMSIHFAVFYVLYTLIISPHAGMDERNERLVFDRIVQSCCGGDDTQTPTTADKSSTVTTFSADQQHIRALQNHKPQYFLVSPKLLQALNAINHPDVTVLMVWNGPGVVDNTWQMADMLRILRSECKRRRIALPPGADGDEDEQEYSRGKKKVALEGGRNSCSTNSRNNTATLPSTVPVKAEKSTISIQSKKTSNPFSLNIVDLSQDSSDDDVVIIE